jgi:hypothetical protein
MAMKRYLLLVTIILTIPVSILAQETPFVPGEILVQLDSHTAPESIVDQIHSIDISFESFQLDKVVNNHMRIWKYTFNPQQTESYRLKRILGGFSQVSLVQFNHYVQEREIPDDPLFGNQWHHIEGDDHDIDTDEAWDLTTGGTTAFGDRIVVCVIEGGGADWDHEDLIDNHWVNDNEIPGNGEDDDNNGFVDDYDGWNPVNENDVIPSGNHGTSVSSMVGSTGDNGVGVTGVNWDVELMQVTVGSLNEANVIAAYEYPLVMRKKYNWSGGSEGAFVVATNASWGIDFGQPDDAPMWCAMYDTLGTYGVLNCGATANNNVNIDEVGDLPTGCGSDYMVSVTATNDEDVRTFSGYGIETVDLGAPGESVYLAEAGNDYGNHSGTSFASPCVAGAIALLYSAPCPSMMALVHASPQEGANYILSVLYEGVDPVDNLADEVVTGGRLNAANSLDLVILNCSDTECLTPFAISVDQVGDTDYEVSWGMIDSMIGFEVRYKATSSADWIQATDIDSSPFLIEDLEWCTEYEVQIMAHCDKESSDWSTSVVWTTDGCCEPPALESISVSDVSETGATLSWEDILAATNYDIEITVAGENDWQVFPDIINIQFVFSNLEPCTAYEVRIASNCDGDGSGYSAIFEFNTPGCGNCADLEYCVIGGDGTSEWIAKVELNTIDNESGSDNGYGDYTNISTDLTIGETYSITLTPGYSSTEWTEYFKVWIDFNANGEFEDIELAYDAGGTTTEAITGNIEIPSTAYPGSVRMRVGMDYVGAFGGGAPPESCTDNAYGETEDYCLLLEESNNVNEFSQVSIIVFPNPADDQLNLRFNDNSNTEKKLLLLSSSGKIVLEEIVFEDDIVLCIWFG